MPAQERMPNPEEPHSKKLKYELPPTPYNPLLSSRVLGLGSLNAKVDTPQLTKAKEALSALGLISLTTLGPRLAKSLLALMQKIT